MLHAVHCFPRLLFSIFISSAPFIDSSITWCIAYRLFSFCVYVSVMWSLAVNIKSSPIVFCTDVWKSGALHVYIT